MKIFKSIEIRKIAFFIGVLFVLNSNLLAQQSTGRSRGTAPTPHFSTGRSGVLFDFAVFYGQDEATANPVSNNEYTDNNSVYDIKLGYVFNNDYYLGADYTVQNYTYIGGTSTGSSTGVGIGYFFGNGFNLRAFYKFNQKFDTYSDGTGFQADLNYVVNFSSNFYMGFEVSHRQTTYKTNTTIANFDKWTTKNTNPAITFGFLIN